MNIRLCSLWLAVASASVLLSSGMTACNHASASGQQTATGGNSSQVAAESPDSAFQSAKEYKVINMPTPNITPGVNDVRGIILHHTAEPTAQSSLDILSRKGSGASCHVLIDTDGTRYVLAEPNEITWHAGKSRLNGRENCNNFTVGIEFQGNTLESPLTDDQIASAIEYIKPIMKDYNIPIENVVSHEYIRTQYKKAHPGSGVPDKVDVTPAEHQRVIAALQK